MEPSRPHRPLTVDDIVRIASYQDREPSHEARVIAFAYHRLALDLSRHLGRDANNWYCFAVWASKTVSENLDLSEGSPFLAEAGRRLNVPNALRRPFRHVLLALLGPSYRLGLALANRAIFLEMGSLAADLWAGGPEYSVRVRESREAERPGGGAPAGEGAPAQARRPAFLTRLLSPADETLLDTVVEMFTRAKDEPDPALRAELVLGANVALVAYEQQRAQQALELVLYRPPRWLMRAPWHWLRGVLTGQAPHRLEVYLAPHASQPWPVRQAERWWAGFYTRHMMGMVTPIGRIRLGRPLPPPRRAATEPLWAPIRDADVRKLIEDYVPDPERAADGVTDWLDFDDRMRFIVAFFRTYLTVPELFAAPFVPPTADGLLADMDDGQVPEPFREWRQGQATRRRTRVPILRQLYRSPLRADPDADALARVDLAAFSDRRPLSP
ncbi:hypothetical protein [Actinomadura sp. 9N407]|uniref:hypothetical protein n=1 Tax=Actinomadura sp. 9N407 TaxID=3375154 RepID=UPI00379DCF9A